MREQAGATMAPGTMTADQEADTVSPRKARKSLLPKQVSIRLEPDLWSRAKALLPLVKAHPELKNEGPWDRSRLLRRALRVGLEALEARVKGSR